MTTHNVKLDSNEVTPMSHAQITDIFAVKYPAWAASAIASSIIHDLVNRVHDADKDYIEIDSKETLYEVIDTETASEQSSIGSFDADDYNEGLDESDEDYDEDDYVESWVEDIEANLTGLIGAYRAGVNSEFLVLIN